jgi:hypothetical protein
VEGMGSSVADQKRKEAGRDNIYYFSASVHLAEKGQHSSDHTQEKIDGTLDNALSDFVILA